MPESNRLIVTADVMGGVAQIWFWGLTDFFFFLIPYCTVQDF